MNDPPITYELVDSIAILKFNRPDDRNSLSSQILDILDDALSNIINDKQVECVVFTGTQDVFLSGAHIRELTLLDQKSAYDFSLKGQKLIQRVAEAKPVMIAAINGYCMGGGLDFALACDIRVANPTAVFAHPGARLGIITGWGGTQRLARLVGKSRALEMFTTARWVSSSEAQRIGLITGIYEPVLEGALTLARRVISS